MGLPSPSSRLPGPTSNPVRPRSRSATPAAQEHTASGAHRNVLTPFPRWVPDEIAAAARTLSESEARAQLGAWASDAKRVARSPAPLICSADRLPGEPRARDADRDQHPLTGPIGVHDPDLGRAAPARIEKD